MKVHTQHGMFYVLWTNLKGNFAQIKCMEKLQESIMQWQKYATMYFLGIYILFLNFRMGNCFCASNRLMLI